MPGRSRHDRDPGREGDRHTSDRHCESARRQFPALPRRDAVIDYASTCYVDTVAEVTGGKGVDVVFDTIGGVELTHSPLTLVDSGRVVSIVDIAQPQDRIEAWGHNAEYHFVFIGATLPLARMARLTKSWRTGGRMHSEARSQSVWRATPWHFPPPSDRAGQLRPAKVARYSKGDTSRSRRKCSRRFDPVPRPTCSAMRSTESLGTRQEFAGSVDPRPEDPLQRGAAGLFGESAQELTGGTRRCGAGQSPAGLTRRMTTTNRVGRSSSRYRRSSASHARRPGRSRV